MAGCVPNADNTGGRGFSIEKGEVERKDEGRSGGTSIGKG